MTLHVVAAAIVQDGRLLVVSKRGAERVFYIPGGKPDPGETEYEALVRELREELGVHPVDAEPFSVVEELAALERVPMRMVVYTVALSGEPVPAAELAAMGWTDGRHDEYAPLLAPAVGRHL